MTKVIGGMAISLDGYASDPNGDIRPLYTHFEEFLNSEMLQEEIRTTGAVILGRRSFDLADHDSYAANYEFQAPLFIMTHRVPTKHPQENDKLTVTFVTDGIESAVAQAKAAAGAKNVMLIGASITQQAINAGLCDELHMSIVPIILGGGVRLFENIDGSQLTLEKIATYESAGRTDLWYRLVK